MPLESFIASFSAFHETVRGILAAQKALRDNEIELERLRLDRERIKSALEKLKREVLQHLGQDRAAKQQDFISRGLFNNTIMDATFAALDREAYEKIRDAEVEATRAFEEIALTERRLKPGFFAKLLRRVALASLILPLMASCSSPNGSVPSNAILVAERSAGLAFAASENGTVYITNKSSGKVIYATEVKPGDKLIFYPETKRIILNGTVVKEDSSFDPKQVHRLYFLKG